MRIRLLEATPADAVALTALQVEAFEADARRYSDAPPGGPPGYDDVAWQVARMSRGGYFKILEEDALVGGAIVFRTGPASCEVGRIWVAPDREGRGVGGRALELLEQAFPEAVVWTLDTPSWATRNHRFYEHRGYRRVREEWAHGMRLVFFEKRRGPA